MSVASLARKSYRVNILHTSKQCPVAQNFTIPLATLEMDRKQNRNRLNLTKLVCQCEPDAPVTLSLKFKVRTGSRVLNHGAKRIRDTVRAIDDRDQSVPWLPHLSTVDNTRGKAVLQACSICRGAPTGRRNAVRDKLYAYVAEHLGDPGSVVAIDETGFPKKGMHSTGVALHPEPYRQGDFLSLCQPPGSHAARPGAVPARRLDVGSDAAAGGGVGPRHALRDQAATGPGARPGWRETQFTVTPARCATG